MARQGIPYGHELWARHEKLYADIFKMALLQLASSGCDTSHEEKISEFLCPILHEICYQENKKRNREILVPDWEKPIQPKAKTELRGGKIRKRPDFTCKWVNTLAIAAEEYEISLHVECKRLGEPSSSSWRLNENYVVEGMMRFDSVEHGYGKRALSGIMIGYVVSMTPEQILIEVNDYQKAHCPDNPEINNKLIENGLWEHRQKLLRKNTKPTGFGLVHLWVDLRKP